MTKEKVKPFMKWWNRPQGHAYCMKVHAKTEKGTKLQQGNCDDIILKHRGKLMCCLTS